MRVGSSYPVRDVRGAVIRLDKVGRLADWLEAAHEVVQLGGTCNKRTSLIRLASVAAREYKKEFLCRNFYSFFPFFNNNVIGIHIRVSG